MSEVSVTFGMGEGVNPTEGAAASSPAVIEFLCDAEIADSIPHPQKSVRFAPDWFRNLEREMDLTYENGMTAGTVKACLPVTDAFSLGFVIPLPYDVQFLIPEDRVSIRMGWPDNCAFQPVEQHHPGQIGAPSPPFEAAMPLKFINPWRIKVPDGYSVLFMQVMNRPELPFTCFSGLVDCDRFATTINFPFLWTGPVGEFLLPAGSPMIQIVPVKRDALIKSHNVRAPSDDERAEQETAQQRKYNEESTYRREWRVKK
ncbi:MAG: hypothetical protein AAGK02_10795 [Pseudomonadota bacterium]